MGLRTSLYSQKLHRVEVQRVSDHQVVDVYWVVAYDFESVKRLALKQAHRDNWNIPSGEYELGAVTSVEGKVVV